MTSATNPKVVELYGNGCQHEAIALGAITPGMLVERAAGGVQAHSTSAGVATPAFAQEYGMTGLSIDDEYATGDQVVFKTYAAGSGIYALLAAAAPAVAESALLVSAGDGTVKALVAAEGGTVVGKALEAVDNSAGADVARIRIETFPAAYVAPVA